MTQPSPTARREAVTHEDLAVMIAGINERLSAGDTRFDAVASEMAALRETQADHARVVAENTASVNKLAEVQEAWVAVRGAGNFVIWWGKVLGGLTLTLASLGAIAKFKLWAIFGGQ